MDCADIQRHLSEYIDGVLDAQTKDIMEKHLSSCKECQTALESFEALVHNLGKFKPVKAPDDFLEQLHKRMDTRFDFKRFLQDLFMPFRTRIPMQLAAAVAMAVLIFAIVYVPQIKKELSDTAVDKIHEAIEEQETDTITASVPMERKVEVRQPGGHSAKKLVAESNKPEMHSTKEMAPAKRPMPAPPVLLPAAQTAPPLSRSKEIQRVELKLLLKRSEMEKGRGHSYDTDSPTIPAPEKTTAGALGAASPEKLGGTALKDQKTVDYLIEDKASRDKIYRDKVAQETATRPFSSKDESEMQVLSPYEAQKQIEELITHIKGTIHTIDYKDGTDMPESIDVDIPALQYAFFYDQLKKIGTLGPSMPQVDANRIDPIRVRVRLVVIHPKGP